MATSTPSKEQCVTLFIFFSWRVESIRIKLEWLRIKLLVQMDVPYVVCHECAFIDSSIPNLKIIDNVAAEKCTVGDKTHSLAYDIFYDGQLILPCRHWYRGQASMNGLRK